MALQFSRGCPFNCEFCDIIRMFGRAPRTKLVEQFLRVVLRPEVPLLPVAVTDVGSVREMLVDGEEGFIVSSGDDEALAEKLLFLASNPDEARRMGERGRERVKRDFTVEAMISGYETLARALAPPE